MFWNGVCVLGKEGWESMEGKPSGNLRIVDETNGNATPTLFSPVSSRKTRRRGVRFSLLEIGQIDAASHVFTFPVAIVLSATGSVRFSKRVGETENRRVGFNKSSIN